MYIFLITLFGLILRCLNIVKPEGLWNDEYVSWYTASVPFNDGFWAAVMKQCHMPLYYFYLKPFVNCSDTILRLTSVMPSVIAIPVMYLVGKEFSEKCGKYCALITAILPFLVYYSQEVRFYSLLFLLSSCLLLFLIRSLKSEKRFDIFMLGLFSFLVMFTHILGIFYVLICLGYYAYSKRLIKKGLVIFISVSLILALPLALNILTQIPSAQWWGRFSYTNLLFLFTDFFSPILTNNVNAPPVFFYKSDLFYNSLMLIPSVIGIIGLIKGIKIRKELFLISLIYVFLICLISLSGKLVFITKYVIEILPVFIFLMSIGFSEFNNKILGKVLIFVFLLINLLAIATPYYASLKIRNEGNRIPALILNEQKPDNIIFTYYAQDRFYRYLNFEPNAYHISKINRFEFKDNPEKILDNIKRGENLSIVFLDSVSFIPENLVEQSEQKGLPEMFITFSKIRNRLTASMKNRCDKMYFTNAGSWTVLHCKNFK